MTPPPDAATTDEQSPPSGGSASRKVEGSTTLDASALLMPLVGFISSRDPRWLSTLAAIERELVDDALVYRYLTEHAAADGLTGSEGTFCMCSYWFIEDLARAGEVDRARLLFEKMHGYANHLGLYARGDGLHRPVPRELPASVHPPRAHQRRPVPGRCARRTGTLRSRPPHHAQEAL
jgi:hypothetical protein